MHIPRKDRLYFDGDYEAHPQGKEVDAQGGLACLAQARQNRPGIGELDLTNIPIVM